MALTFHVEDQLHRRVRMFTDDPQNSFLSVCRCYANAGTSVMDTIDPYADAMLNFMQLDRLIAELGRILENDVLAPGERRLVLEVRSAAIEARQLSGYLYIQGE